MTIENPIAGPEKTNFTEINLSEVEKKKAPKRVVHFSDGVLEEFSTDDEELDGDNPDTQPLIDPKTLPWVPYFGYMIWWLGSRTLAVCDYLGENLAWILGITSPKFQYELDQYERMAKEEEEFEKYIKAENAGWSVNDSENNAKNIILLQPRVISNDAFDVQTDDTAGNEKLNMKRKLIAGS